MAASTLNTVLIHGFGFDYRTWYPLELAFEGHHVIYLSLPGFGMERVTEPYTIAGLAQKFWDHLDEIDIDQVNIVGHSMGGYVCMEMLALNPSRVASLALIHSHVFEDSAEKKTARTASMNDIRASGHSGMISKFYPSLFADPQKSAPLINAWSQRGGLFDNNAWYYGTLAMRDRADHAETLKSTSIPVLQLMGQADKAVPAELSIRQSVLAERTSFQLYPSVGHMGMYEHTQEMIADLISFYADFAK